MRWPRVQRAAVRHASDRARQRSRSSDRGAHQSPRNSDAETPAGTATTPACASRSSLHLGDAPASCQGRGVPTARGVRSSSRAALPARSAVRTPAIVEVPGPTRTHGSRSTCAVSQPCLELSVRLVIMSSPGSVHGSPIDRMADYRRPNSCRRTRDVSRPSHATLLPSLRWRPSMRCVGEGPHRDGLEGHARRFVAPADGAGQPRRCQAAGAAAHPFRAEGRVHATKGCDAVTQRGCVSVDELRKRLDDFGAAPPGRRCRGGVCVAALTGDEGARCCVAKVDRARVPIGCSC